MTLKIEKGIPVPPHRRGSRNRPSKYPLELLEVGDSFFVPGADERERAQAMSSIASRWKRGKFVGGPKRFTTRVVEGGVRCWRLADVADDVEKDAVSCPEVESRPSLGPAVPSRSTAGHETAVPPALVKARRRDQIKRDLREANRRKRREYSPPAES